MVGAGSQAGPHPGTRRVARGYDRTRVRQSSRRDRARRPARVAAGGAAGRCPGVAGGCPSEFRAYPSLRRHLVLLAWLAGHHVDAQLVALRQAYRTIRVDLTDRLPEGAVEQAMTDIELEGVRLRAARRGTLLISEALQDRRLTGP